MNNYTFFAIIIIIYAQQAYAEPPKHVHLHTSEEIFETKYVVLDKLNVCHDSQNVNSRLIIAIKTAPMHREQRDTVRKAWLTKATEYHIPYIFVLGSSTDEKILDELLVEDKLHNDLLIGKPVDNYYNLTLKGMFLLTWARTYCSTHWLLYVDDDVIVNVQQVIDFMGSVRNVSDPVLYCNIHNHVVVRDPQSQWFVPLSAWKFDAYPDYCTGIGYLIPPNTLPLLHEGSTNSSTESKLWIDDVFITGIVTKAVGIKVIQAPFYCCGGDGLKLFNKSLVLGEMGKGVHLLKRWEQIRGNSTSHIQIQPRSVMSMSETVRFHRKGLLLTPKIQTDYQLLKFMTKENYQHIINYLFCSTILFVIMVTILLYKRFHITPFRAFLKAYR